MAPLNLNPASDRITLAVRGGDDEDPAPLAVLSLFPGIPLSDSVGRALADAGDEGLAATVSIATEDYVELRLDTPLDPALRAPAPLMPERGGLYVCADRSGLILWFASEGAFPTALEGALHVGQFHAVSADTGLGSFDPAEIGIGMEMVLSAS